MRGQEALLEIQKILINFQQGIKDMNPKQTISYFETIRKELREYEVLKRSCKHLYGHSEEETTCE